MFVVMWKKRSKLMKNGAIAKLKSMYDTGF